VVSFAQTDEKLHCETFYPVCPADPCHSLQFETSTSWETEILERQLYWQLQCLCTNGLFLSSTFLSPTKLLEQMIESLNGHDLKSIGQQ
jgi:hypothetical protein